jgi:predicted nucleic acid-binding protein
MSRRPQGTFGALVRPIVLDTNVVIVALRSQRGASFAILSEIGKSWVPLISVPLILEYEAVAKREAERLEIPEKTVEIVRAAAADP